MGQVPPEHGSSRVSRLRGFLEVTGGFTLHQHSGEPVRAGYSVCADPSATLCFPLHEWDDDQVGGWLATWTERILGTELHLGGWLEPSTLHVWLDVVRVYPTHRRGDAVELALAHRQRALFDLDQGRLVMLGQPAASTLGA